jgi:hypothetical protein
MYWLCFFVLCGGVSLGFGTWASSKIRSFEVSHSAETDELGEPPAHDLIFQNAAASSPIRLILIPIDAMHVKPVDLKPILKVAQRFDRL